MFTRKVDRLIPEFCIIGRPSDFGLAAPPWLGWGQYPFLLPRLNPWEKLPNSGHMARRCIGAPNPPTFPRYARVHLPSGPFPSPERGIAVWTLRRPAPSAAHRALPLHQTRSRVIYGYIPRGPVKFTLPTRPHRSQVRNAYLYS